MKIQNRPVWFGITVALILFLVPLFGSRALSRTVSGIVGPIDGVTHLIEFVDGSVKPTRLNRFAVGLKSRLIIICVGDSVEFKNNGKQTVNAFSTVRAFKFDTTPLSPGESNTIGPFPAPGVFWLYTDVVSGSVGAIVVVDCSSSSSKGRDQSLKDGRLEFLKKLEKTEGKKDVQWIIGEKDGDGDNSGKQNARSETGRGLNTTTFDTLYGQVIVNLPDDMAAGDTVSGTVVTQPGGTTEEEKARNKSKLDECLIAIEAVKLPSKQHSFVWDVPANETKAAVPYTLRIFEGDSGKELATIDITPEPKIIGGEFPSPPSRLDIPPFVWTFPAMGQQGRPIEIIGPFDGKMANTKLMYGPAGSSIQDFEKNTENVLGGFGLINPIAKSPRKCVFEAPTNVTGPIELYLKEGNKETKGTYRNVGVNLSAPKTSLLRGERTTLTFQGSGLQGIKEPVRFTLESHGVIVMEGGPYQPLVIQPSEVGADGRYSTTRDITGVQTGVWGATATVVTHRFDFCLQDDSNPRTVVLVNSFTGNYLFPLPGGTSLSGTGTVTRKGCIITLTDSRPDRRVQGNIDPCTKTGSASVQTVSPKVKFTITDRNIRDNTCTCGPGCK